MSYIRNNVEDMNGYIPGYQPEEEGWVKLNQNENPYPPSPRVLDAIRNELGSLKCYPETSSALVRKEAAKLYGIAPEQILVTNGSDEMLRILLESCVSPGDEVVAFYPSYTYYRTLAAMQGAYFRLIDFSDDWGLPEKLGVEDAKVVFLPNPNAPSGTLFSEGDIAKLCGIVLDGIVVVDEAYGDFAQVSAIQMLKDYPNLVVTRTFSKSYSLAGLRLGLGFASQELIRQFDKVRDFYDVDRLAQVGALAALQDQDYFRSNLQKVINTRSRLTKELSALGVEVIPSQANFVLAKFTNPTAKDVYQQLRERKILVRYFETPRLEDCLRISIGTDEETDKLISAIASILAD
ncbi:MAG: histidinol-phosphate transaminase [Planctomycetes bacterium]|nr:histidinol-phosphate transaminase [Planctomycetota bacterium]